jgi:hypothetical protein
MTAAGWLVHWRQHAVRLFAAARTPAVLPTGRSFRPKSIKAKGEIRQGYSVIDAVDDP